MDAAIQHCNKGAGKVRFVNVVTADKPVIFNFHAQTAPAWLSTLSTECLVPGIVRESLLNRQIACSSYAYECCVDRPRVAI
jgi:hypothetical protein